MLEHAQKQAQDLQHKMKQTVVEASSGGGTVTVKMNGQKQVLETRIDPEAVKAGRRGDAAGPGDRRRERGRTEGG